jgi:hypothetical protein
MLKQIQMSVGQIPDLMIQLGAVNFPYMFNLLTAHEFDTFMKSKESTLNERPTTEKIEEFTGRAQELFQCCCNFLDSSRNKKVSAVGKRSWKFLTMKRTEKVYLQLLCGMALLPLVSA